VIRARVFDPDEVAAIVAECEALLARVVATRCGTRRTVGSYTFETDELDGTIDHGQRDHSAVAFLGGASA
jgi:hypothetical protein